MKKMNSIIGDFKNFQTFMLQSVTFDRVSIKISNNFVTDSENKILKNQGSIAFKQYQTSKFPVWKMSSNRIFTFQIIRFYYSWSFLEIQYLQY